MSRERKRRRPRRGQPYRTGAISAAALLATSLAACGPSEADGVVELRLANIFDAKHPYTVCGIEPMAEHVDERTHGKVRIVNYPGGQLGSQDEVFELVGAQTMDMTIAGSAVLASRYAPVGILNAAYLFSGVDQMLATVNGPIGARLWEGLEREFGVHVLSSWYNGTRQFTTGDRPVRRPADLDGQEIRAVDSPVTIASLDAMGASPAPVALEELYLALQQGTVDGQENPTPVIDAENMAEVQDYLSVTKHVFQSTQVVISDAAWDELSVEQQKTVQQAVENFGDRVRDCVEKKEAEILDGWRKSGQFEVVDDVDIDEFARRSDRYWSSSPIAREWIDGMYDKIKEEAR